MVEINDHREIGKTLKLFCFDDDVGAGLPLWLPSGTVLIEELEKLAKETEFLAGYDRVRTPHIARENLYLTSGHLPYYEDRMFPFMNMESESGNIEKYYLKAMNCPHHHKIFGSSPRSYRDLPLRLAEYGTCYRYEQSGELFGLMRVRSMQMNDAHIYCTEDQFEKEFNAVNEMYLKYFKIFGIEKYLMRFSTHDSSKLGQKFVDSPELWKKTEDMLRNALIKSGINFVEVPNEAAFYGPKIDVQVWSTAGKEFTLATNQIDFAVPARFNLKYKTENNTEETPLCIHRAPLGTHERFIGFLIEHYNGNFPLWLSPIQINIMTVKNTESVLKYAEFIKMKLLYSGIRVKSDLSNDNIKNKIRKAEQEKSHTMLVIGDRDVEDENVGLRVHGKGNLGIKNLNLVLEELLSDIKNRK